MQNKTILDSRITASSMWDSYHSPERARLGTIRVGKNRGGWSAKTNDLAQWIQVDFVQITKVTRIATQGREDADQWVSSYAVQYSVDGGSFENYKEGWVLRGNSDKNSIVRNVFDPAIIARYIRIRPKSWHGHISMRFEIYGCRKRFDLPAPKCGHPLGLESNVISDSQMTASSEWNLGHRAANARLHFRAGAGRTGAWSALHNNADQWLQIDFIDIARIAKIATQGRQDSDQWVTSYFFSYSRDGVFWKDYPHAFPANSDRGTVVRHQLQQKIYARFLQIHPRTWHGHISLRAEVYGCASGFQVPSESTTCMDALGMKNQTIPDSRITASSMWDANHSPTRARLGTTREDQNRGAWSAKTNDLGQWIQVDFVKITKVTRIATQGREDADQWVSSYILEFSLDGRSFEKFNEGWVLRGNSDRNSIVGNVLDPAIIARYVRIRTKTWYGHISMRFEVYGCKNVDL